MNTTIVIPPSVDKATTPKPKRSEIIEAAARREYEKQLKEYNDWETAKHNEEQALIAKVKSFATKAAVRLVSAASFGIGSGYNENWDSKEYTDVRGVALNIDLRHELPEALTKDIVAHHNKYRTYRSRPSFKDVHRYMKSAFSERSSPVNQDRESRINALLSDKKSLKAIDAMIEEIRKPTKPMLTP